MGVRDTGRVGGVTESGEQEHGEPRKPPHVHASYPLSLLSTRLRLATLRSEDDWEACLTWGVKGHSRSVRVLESSCRFFSSLHLSLLPSSVGRSEWGEATSVARRRTEWTTIDGDKGAEIISYKTIIYSLVTFLSHSVSSRYARPDGMERNRMWSDMTRGERLETEW